MKKTAFFRTVLGALTLCAAVSHAATPATYPDKVITVIAPYSAGGDSDLAARNFAAAAQKALGTSVIVVNKPGASGVVGSAQVVSAAPDGYTLLLARPGSQSILPAILPTKTRYKWDDFTMIGLLELNAYGCIVPAASFHTFEEFAAALKVRGKSFNYGTAGVLTTNDMGPRQLFKLLKLGDNAPTQIPYKGTGEAMISLVAGNTQFACGSISSFLPLIKSGQLRALMVTTPERIASLPDVPTAREVGLPEMEKIIGWSGIYGPPNLPADIIQKLSAALKTISTDTDWQKATELSGSIPYIRSPDETRKFAHEQFELYRSLGTALDIIDKEE